MWFLIAVGSFLALYMGLCWVFAADEGPYGWVIRGFEIGVPLTAAVVLLVLCFMGNRHAGAYELASGAFAIATYQAATRKIEPDHPFFSGGHDGASTVIVYMVAFAAGCLLVGGALYGLLRD